MDRRISAGLACVLLAGLAGTAWAGAQTFGLDGQPAPQAARADWVAQARGLEQRADWPGLLALGQAWARVEANNPLAWFVQGRAWSALGRPRDAIAAYERNLHLAPDDVQARNNLGNVLRDSGRPREAMRAYRAAVERDPDYLPAWHNLGLTFYLSRGQAGVAQALDRLRATDPALAEVWRKLAVEYSVTRDPRVAREAISVLRDMNGSARAHMFSILVDDF
jgi:tetratricopeptide (TPR) repeat protein